MSDSRNTLSGVLPLISTGLDLEDLDRWQSRDLEILRPDTRIFSAAERAYCEDKADPVPHYAARWCAKEAVVKAFAPLCRLHVTQIEVLSGENGPQIKFHTEVPHDRIIGLSLSMTHTKHTAAASVVLLYQPSVQLE